MFQARLKQISLLLLSTLALSAVLRLIITEGFNLSLNPAFAHRDYIGNLLVALLAYLLTQHLPKALILSTVLISGFHLCNATKLVVLGTPISPDDFIQVRNLFWLWSGWLLLGTVLIALLPLALLAALIHWRSRLTWLTFALLGATVFISAFYRADISHAMDRQFGHSVWNQPENYSHRGVFLHIVQESYRTWTKFDNLPTKTQIAQIPPPTPRPAIGSGEKRNVHLILLETFFDPVSLGKDWVPIDPFPASFRKLWAETGQSKVLVPVFGGYTANAEFEALCGFPVTEDAVFFEGWLRRPAPCLPAVLKKAGYTTVASHPNVAGFWNRSNAYPLIGFEHYFAKNRFDLTDSVRNILLDHSFYRQVDELLQTLPANKPVFNFMLTYHGHLPYPSNETYPEVVKGRGQFPLLNGYLSHMYYKSRDFIAQVDKIRRNDPNALIVAFGDHLPFLGPNHEVFTQAGVLTPKRDQLSPSQFEYLVSTPLIVIDGQRGPLKLGTLPLYRLPERILQWLGLPERGTSAFTQQPAGELVRPLPGMHFTRDAEGIVVCQNKAGEKAPSRCARTEQWLKQVKQRSKDIFSGDQHSLKGLD